MKKDIPEAIFKQFAGLASDLSPENLCCDGEISKAEVNRRYKAIMIKWRIFEMQVGRRVSIEEIETEQMARWDKEWKNKS